MSTLIFQIDIGKGTQWSSEETIKVIRNIFIPSVKKYAKKFNYDYKLITESEYEKNGGDFLFLATREKHFSFERYFHIKEKYDQIVYIDNDVYVVDKAQPLPTIKGLMNAPEPESYTTYVFRDSHNLESTIKYYNSGVIFMDKDTFEQKILSKGQVDDVLDFLLENTNVTIAFDGNEAIEVKIPQHMDIKIIETDPGEKGNTSQGGTKPAILETGVSIQVPLFIQIGDKVKVDTKEKRYIERSKK